ncbi:glycosyltransferase family 2 protein [Nakamurella sp. GG22]
MTTAVITIVSGRHDHLRNQQRGLRSGTVLPEHYVVVAMHDPKALQLTLHGPLAGSGCAIHLVGLPVGQGLPLAAARNAGATAALAAGADILIFLDVDCVPSPSLVESYAEAARSEAAPALHCGVVRYLGPEIDAGDVDSVALAGRPHPARPTLKAGESIDSLDWPLFWSLSFAVSKVTWRRLGGFREDYQGYGAEDTDFGYHAFLAGVNIRWLGGADAFHQYHETQDPPVQHLRDIVTNATIFHARWGFWPMAGWLSAFRELGLVEYDDNRDRWMITPPAMTPARR